MYTAYIGRRIVDLYNEHIHDGSSLSPRTFFDEVFFPVFFDHEKYLMWVNNSKFDQAYKQRKRTPLTSEVRQEALASFHADAASLEEPHMHLYLGGTASEVSATTSGQVSDVAVPVDADEIYCSWVGAAASIGVSGGLSLLLDQDKVLLALIEGWTVYRRYMTETPTLKGHQVETWNGWWLAHRFSEDFRSDQPLRDFDPKTRKSGKTIRLDTQDWVQVMFALALSLSGPPLTAYVFTLGNTNQTVGFRQLYLSNIRLLVDLYVRLFGEVDGIDSRGLAALYQTEFSFRMACRQGIIGLRALQPSKLGDYMPGRGQVGKLPKTPRKDAHRVTYHIYLTWIIAMLNNQDLVSFAEKAADALYQHARSDTKGRTTAKRRAEQALETANRRSFIDGLTEIIKSDSEHAKLFDGLVDEVATMPASDFPLLLTLMRFKFAVRNNK